MRLSSIQEIWAQYKVVVLKVSLALGAIVLVLAQFVPQVGDFLSSQRYLSVGAAIALLLLLLDTVMSPAPASQKTQSSYPAVLRHTGDLSQFFPALLKERRITFDIASYSSETFYNHRRAFGHSP